MRRELAGDLDNVVMKALRKEPSERYRTADEMREDIARYVEGRPVSAPPFFPAGAARKESARDERRTLHDETSLAVLPLKVHESTGGPGSGRRVPRRRARRRAHHATREPRRFTLRPTSSVLRYRGQDADPLAAGRELGVSYVLEGRVRRSGATLRVTLQLLDVREGSAVWAGQFDEDTADVLQLEDSISEQVAEALVPQLTGGERLRLQKRGTENASAYEEYMRGRYHWNTFNEEGFARALVHYSRAVSLRPGLRARLRRHQRLLQRARRLRRPPLRRDERRRARSRAQGRRLRPLSGRGLGRARLRHADARPRLGGGRAPPPAREELNPNYVTGRLWLSFFLGMEGRFEEALSIAHRALEIAPLTPLVRHTLNWNLYHARRFDEAAASARVLISTEPDYGLGHLLLSLALAQVGRHDEAIETCEKAGSLLGRSPYSLCFLAALNAHAGREREARALLEEVGRLGESRYVSPYMLALVALSARRHGARVGGVGEGRRDS